MAKKRKELLQNNQRRVARMRIWMKQAEEVPHGDEHDHIRLLFYFIAYEAAYQQEKVSKEPQWKSFNRVVSRFAKIEVLKALQAHRQDVENLLKLRQANPYFWYKQQVQNLKEWENKFKHRVESSLTQLDVAIEAEQRVEVIKILDLLFENLRLVRNQIVHGGNAGRDSRGRTQVNLAASLMESFVPCFLECIETRISKDWGNPPFPRVGSESDQECKPPWLA